MECSAHSSFWWTSRHRSLPHHTGEVLIKRALRQSKQIWRCTFKPITYLTPLCQSKRQLVCDVMCLGDWCNSGRHIIQIQKDNVGLVQCHGYGLPTFDAWWMITVLFIDLFWKQIEQLDQNLVGDPTGWLESGCELWGAWILNEGLNPSKGQAWVWKPIPLHIFQTISVSNSAFTKHNCCHLSWSISLL